MRRRLAAGRNAPQRSTFALASGTLLGAREFGVQCSVAYQRMQSRSGSGGLRANPLCSANAIPTPNRRHRKPVAAVELLADVLDGIVTTLSKSETTCNNGLTIRQYHANRDIPCVIRSAKGGRLHLRQTGHWCLCENALRLVRGTKSPVRNLLSHRNA